MARYLCFPKNLILGISTNRIWISLIIQIAIGIGITIEKKR
ncbi:uncharacterized protein Dvar_18000 [Desulfosarcina variabilis str. Montpellier]